MIARMLNLSALKNSIFLFGPRQTGKTSLISNTLQPDLFINLLDYDSFMRYSTDHSLLVKEVDRLTKGHALVVIDEIQKCPDLLNSVHLLMEQKKKVKFILTGSSARKLRKAGVNLLGGRAITAHLYPLIQNELKDLFILDDVLHYGSLPKIYLENNLPEKIRLLKSYVDTYLREEIAQEAIVRNLPAFTRFLEFAADENGNILNFQKIAREIGIHSKTIKEYFQILEDTLIGKMLYPYKKLSRRRLISHPKFYFFDCGIVTALKRGLQKELIKSSAEYGRAFEHWAFLELTAAIDYYEIEASVYFYRTADGAEVDFIIEKGDELWAVEAKASQHPDLASLRGLKGFLKENPKAKAVCLCTTPRPYADSKIEFISCRDFILFLKGGEHKLG
ncbi:MAG: AAA family ATPase [Candidatus Margulisbacteria bacterium]|nr:AAA family ATPase [Candidatus Margulisiibacteriota bacterium]